MFDVPRSPLSGQGIERWDRPSIANVAFVDGLLAQMIEEVRVVLFGLAEPAINPQRELPRVAEKWARILGAGNPNFAQKMTPKGQDEWLRAHGYATGEAGTGASVLALVKEHSSALYKRMVLMPTGALAMSRQTSGWTRQLRIVLACCAGSRTAPNDEQS